MRMKVIVKWCRAFLLLSSFAAWHAYSQQLTVLTEHVFPFQIVKGEEISGPATDIVKMTFDEAEITYHLASAHWSASYKRALNVANTCLYSVGRTEQREDLFEWIGALFEIENGFYASSDKPIVIENLEQAKQYKTLVIKESVAHQFLLNSGFRENEHFYAINGLDALMSLLDNPSREFDLIVANQAMLTYQTQRQASFKKYQPVFNIQDLNIQIYLACNLNSDPGLMWQLRDAMLGLEAAGKFDAIRRPYL